MLPAFRRDAAAVALICAALAVFFRRFLVFGDVFVGRDLTAYFYPTKWIFRSIVLSGEFPFWNPYYHGGQPLAANPEFAVFYPPSWLLLIPDFAFGFACHVVAHYFIAALGMYALLRSMNLAAEGAAFGALTLGLGGYLVSSSNLLPILLTASWVPLILLCARKAVGQPSYRTVSVLALLIGVQALAGEPTTIVQTWLIVAVYAAYAAKRNESTRPLALVGAALLLGIAVGAAQLIPAADLAASSVRARGFDFETASTWSFPPLRMLEVFFPHVTGHGGQDAAGYHGSRLYASESVPYFYSIYGGLAAAIFGIAAVWRDRGSRLMILATLPLLLLAFGSNTPLYRLLWEVGVARAIRFPEKFLLIPFLAFAIAGARGLELFLAGDERTRRIALRAAITVVIVSACAATVALAPSYPRWFERVFALAPGEETERLALVSRIDWLLALARGALFVALITAAKRMRLARVWRLAMALFVVADLTFNASELVVPIERPFLDPPPLADGLRGARLFHEAATNASKDANGSRYFKMGFDTYWSIRNGIFPMTHGLWGIEGIFEQDIDRTNLRRTADFAAAYRFIRAHAPSRPVGDLLAIAGVTHVATFRDFETEAARVSNDARELVPVDVVELPNPKWRLATASTAIQDDTAFVAALLRGTVPEGAAFVEGPRPATGDGRIVSVRESPNRTDLTVECSAPCFLVNSVTFDDYWRATIDGVETSIRPVNLAFQGVEVPAGTHTVRFTYRNRLVTGSAAVSLACGFVLLITAIFARRHSSAAPHAPQQ